MTRGSLLITGATGVVGRELWEQASADGWEVVGCSSRGGAGVVAWPMGSSPPPSQLLREWDVIVHAAARPRWNLAAHDAAAANVSPLEHLLPLLGSGTHLIHVSTAFAVGLRGSIESPHLSDYRNTYEWSKAAAERRLADVGGVTVVRPPLIVGRRGDGQVSRFTGLYTVLQSAVTGLLPAFVGEPTTPLEIVSTCDVAACVLQYARTGPGGAPVVLGSGATAPTVDDVKTTMYDGLNHWRLGAGLLPLDVPTMVRPEQWHRFFLPFMKPHLSSRQQNQIERLSEFIPYMSNPVPLEVTWHVSDVLSAVFDAVRAWAGRRPVVASGSPRPWAPSEVSRR